MPILDRKLLAEVRANIERAAATAVIAGSIAGGAAAQGDGVKPPKKPPVKQQQTQTKKVKLDSKHPAVKQALQNPKSNKKDVIDQYTKVSPPDKKGSGAKKVPSSTKTNKQAGHS